MDCKLDTSRPSCVINRSAPTATVRPATLADTPKPGVASKLSIGARVRFNCFAAVTIDSAIGCSERVSTAATRARTSLYSNPSAGTRSVSSGRPLVSVPVLSSAITLTSRNACKASPLRKSTPSSAARPVPTMIEVGVASPIAHGQAIIRTATALTSAKVSAGDGPKISQTRKVSVAAAITAGTNHMVTLSTSAWIGSFDPCACSTRRMICASTVFAPTLVTQKLKAPVLLIVPPTTSAPTPLDTGTGSPVIMLSST